VIDPDGDGVAPPREVWCDQDRRGGGWALALKIDGERSVFAGSGAAWDDPDLLQADGLDPLAPGEAKLAPYVDSSVAEVMLVVDQRDIVLPLRATSLQAAMASKLAIPTAVPDAEWSGAFGATSLEHGCRRQGFGLNGRANLPGVRIGVIASDEPASCRSPASFIGAGGNIPCPDGTMLAAGAVSSALGDQGARCMPSRVLVFVRDDDRTYHPALPSCASHLAAGRHDNGIYLVGDPAVPRRCEMTIDGGGWTNALDLDSLREPCPPGWQEFAEPRLCVHSVDPAPATLTAASITVVPPLASYRDVMVSVIGFQYGSMDAFNQSDSRTNRALASIDDAYLDGLSITTAAAAGPRRHIASYAVGLREGAGDGSLSCPCLGGRPPPSFVPGPPPGGPGEPPPSAWRCESGSLGGTDEETLHLIDPLFDGAEVPVACGPEASHEPIRTRLESDTSADLEARLMTDEPDDTRREGLAVYRLELWVR
jgi:hypothetical protein